MLLTLVAMLLIFWTIRRILSTEERTPHSIHDSSQSNGCRLKPGRFIKRRVQKLQHETEFLPSFSMRVIGKIFITPKSGQESVRVHIQSKIQFQTISDFFNWGKDDFSVQELADRIGLYQVLEFQKSFKKILAESTSNFVVFSIDDYKSARITEFMLGSYLILENFTHEEVVDRFRPFTDVFGKIDPHDTTMIRLRWEALQIFTSFGRAYASESEPWRDYMDTFRCSC
jgi:hypothetical protein